MPPRRAAASSAAAAAAASDASGPQTGSASSRRATEARYVAQPHQGYPSRRNGGAAAVGTGHGRRVDGQSGGRSGDRSVDAEPAVSPVARSVDVASTRANRKPSAPASSARGLECVDLTAPGAEAEASAGDSGGGGGGGGHTATAATSPASPRLSSAPERTCSICLTQSLCEPELEIGRPTCCAHDFCFECIHRWATDGANECPLCKTVFGAIVRGRVPSATSGCRWPLFDPTSRPIVVPDKRQRVAYHTDSLDEYASSDDDDNYLLGSEYARAMLSDQLDDDEMLSDFDELDYDPALYSDSEDEDATPPARSAAASSLYCPVCGDTIVARHGLRCVLCLSVWHIPCGDNLSNLRRFCPDCARARSAQTGEPTPTQRQDQRAPPQPAQQLPERHRHGQGGAAANAADEVVDLSSSSSMSSPPPQEQRIGGEAQPERRQWHGRLRSSRARSRLDDRGDRSSARAYDDARNRTESGAPPEIVDVDDGGAATANCESAAATDIDSDGAASTAAEAAAAVPETPHA